MAYQRYFRIDNPMHDYEAKYLNTVLLMDESRSMPEHGDLALYQFDEWKPPFGTRVLHVHLSECAEVYQNPSACPDGEYTCRVENGCVEIQGKPDPERPVFGLIQPDWKELTLEEFAEISLVEPSQYEPYWATEARVSDYQAYGEKPIWATQVVFRPE